jgi:hypothetical protein
MLQTPLSLWQFSALLGLLLARQKGMDHGCLNLLNTSSPKQQIKRPVHLGDGTRTSLQEPKVASVSISMTKWSRKMGTHCSVSCKKGKLLFKNTDGCILVLGRLCKKAKRMTQEKSCLAKLDTWRRCDTGTKLEESCQLAGYRIHK